MPVCSPAGQTTAILSMALSWPVLAASFFILVILGIVQRFFRACVCVCAFFCILAITEVAPPSAVYYHIIPLLFSVSLLSICIFLCTTLPLLARSPVLAQAIHTKNHAKSQHVASSHRMHAQMVRCTHPGAKKNALDTTFGMQRSRTSKVLYFAKWQQKWDENSYR